MLARQLRAWHGVPGCLRGAAAARAARSPRPPTRCSSSGGGGGAPEPPPGQPDGDGFKGFQRRPPPADALQEALTVRSAAAGRAARSVNVVLGGAEGDDKWRQLDEQVNEYPGQRVFKAIGLGGDEFAAAMTACVARVVGAVHEECVSQRPSKTAKYVSVTIGPVWVETPDQVLAVYEAMRADSRLRYFI